MNIGNRMSGTKKLLYAGSAAAIVFGSLIAFGADYLYSYALNRKPRHREDENDSYHYDTSFITKADKNDLYIFTKDKKRLHAYEIINHKHPGTYMILCHGYTMEGKFMSEYARMFYNMGFSLIIPDARGHGFSSGDYIGMGWHERLDILTWIRKLNKYRDKPDIALFGVSMGAATVMCTAGEDLPCNVKAVIEDCGYADIYEQFKWNLKRMFHLPAFPLIDAASLIAKERAGYTFKNVGALGQVKKSKVPIMFIHGEKDDFVPYSNLELLYNSAKCEKEKLSVPDAKHAESFYLQPVLYKKEVHNFLSKYINIEKDYEIKA